MPSLVVHTQLVHYISLTLEKLILKQLMDISKTCHLLEIVKICKMDLGRMSEPWHVCAKSIYNAVIQQSMTEKSKTSLVGSPV